MNSRSFTFVISLLLISSLFSLHAKADGAGSVFFLDNPSHPFIRPQLSSKADLISLMDVGAAMSVLLGFAPSPSLSAESSSKLNEVLVPNPFDRPRAVFLLEVKGVEGHVAASDKDLFSNALRSTVIYNKNEVDIHLPDQDDLSVVSLDELSSSNLDAGFSDKELNDFASWLGGSYLANTLETFNGELSIPLKSGGELKLDMSKNADREFIQSLFSLIRNIQRAIELHQDLSANVHNPAELMSGSFSGIKVLQEKYGIDGVARQGLELVATSVSKIFDSLQTAHKGHIVGVIFFKESPSSEESTLNVKFTSQPAARQLQEKKSGPATLIIAEVLLVRRTLAWLTGIILLISTLLGTYFLLYMPITRDTLLYSNVKLD
ncbi:Type 1 membrane protein [Heracleum sosnowskyi]|uniref:Type 1 membrane protein n=1 Tax=Heracleum sosnowskyi TaxID=360622 RepID=A0AAD8MUA8_9APIA|nr:Type 1 membrane protein [Heracleum sosnowskyi]